MASDQDQIVRRLALRMNGVDVEHTIDLVHKYGFYGAARIMGYDISHYNNLLLAGRLAIEYQRQKSPATLLEYAHVMSKRLNKEITILFT